MYQPTMDGDLIPSSVDALLASSNRKLPVLMGLTGSEGLYFTVLGRDRYLNEFFINKSTFSSYALEDFQRFVSTTVAPPKHFADRKEAQTAQREIVRHYAGDENATDVDDYHYLKAYTRLLSDVWFNVPTMRIAKERARRGWPVYLYQNAYYNDKQFPRWMPFRGEFLFTEL